MVQGGTTTTALAAGLSWLALVFVGLVHSAGGDAPPSVELACGAVAAPIAVLGALQSIAAFWRGPIIVPFARGDAVACSPAEAAFIRSSAQLQGLMGGAGHLYPRRLVYPAAAWASASLVGVAVLVDRVAQTVGPWPLAVTAVAAFLALLFPARPFFYRDTTGGGVVLSPPSAAYRLKHRAELAAAIARGEPVEAQTPAPTPSPGVGLGASPVRDPRRG